MKKLAHLLVFAIKICYIFGWYINQLRLDVPRCRYFSSNPTTVIFAKKQSSKLISDELLISILKESDASDQHNPDLMIAKGHESIIEKVETKSSNSLLTAIIDDTTSSRKSSPSSNIRIHSNQQLKFVMLSLDHVGLSFGDLEILNNVTFHTKTGERVGLVGPNGCGKTTQLRILAGEIEPTIGSVVKSSNHLRISFLRQEFLDSLNSSNTLIQELRTPFRREFEKISALNALESALQQSSKDTFEIEKMLQDTQDLRRQIQESKAMSIDSRIEKILDLMGFSKLDQNMIVDSFSGGWKMRIGLAKVLLEEPDILLLDEPTNHMDLDSVCWLETFLNSLSIPQIIVSHDREFLDNVCNKIVEIEQGNAISYNTIYSKFLELRLNRLQVWQDKYEKQLKYIKEEESWLKKARNDPSQSQSIKSRIMTMEKFKNSEEFLKSPPKERRFRFRFPSPPRCSANLIEVENLSHGYTPRSDSTDLLFEDVSFQIAMGNRVGLLGPNGCGKSTIMRIMAMLENPLKGCCKYGSQNVASNYYEQNQADSLILDDSVLDSVQRVAPYDMTATDLRSLLGQFMFKGDDVDKRIGTLSGGEKARVSLLRLLFSPTNFLLLDEPTNHLDITSKEVLEEALQNYPGGLVVISHDRYFLSKVVNKIFSFENKKIVKYDMDFHDFMKLKGEAFTTKVLSRHVCGDTRSISKALPVIIPPDVKSRKFGGSGISSGNIHKGIKNSKRYN